MRKTKRKTRSDKFPLTLHPTGQYCKKIKGKIYYFGTDKKQALERYLDFLSFLLKMTIMFTTHTAAKNDTFSQKLPGSAAVLFHPYTRRGFTPPFTVQFVYSDWADSSLEYRKISCIKRIYWYNSVLRV